jgi:PmbA protein
MQRGYWYTVARSAGALEQAAAVGAKAAERTVAKLGARKLRTTAGPVLFEAPAAASLIGHFVGAVSGFNLYRKASFLVDALDTDVFSPEITIDERPHLPQGLGSAPFDHDGVATRPRTLVENGVLRGYVLDGYAARRLALAPTGNAGGVRNLCVSHHTKSFDTLIAEMGRGVLVTDLMGFGVNLVTGDYSRGASGFWIEDGMIQYPVEEITVAGNLRDIFKRIVAVGDDVDMLGARAGVAWRFVP